MQNYLSKRHQRVRNKYCYSSLEEILFGVPQGSIIDSILFNILLSNLYLIFQDVNIASNSCADDSMIYQSCNNLDDVKKGLDVSAEKLFYWFADNKMKGNTDDFHLIMSTNNAQEIQVGEFLIKTSNYEKLLYIKIVYKLTFNNHVNNLCKKANNRPRALARARPYMNLEKKKLLMNPFFNAQFNYSPLI